MATAQKNAYKPAYNPENEGPWGPSVIEKRTTGTPLTQLGTSFMEFTEEGSSDPWVLRYEETIYVISGRTEVDILDQDGEFTVVGEPGELIVLPEGTEVRYRGEKGTRLLLSITPVNWRETLSGI